MCKLQQGHAGTVKSSTTIGEMEVELGFRLNLVKERFRQRVVIFLGVEVTWVRILSVKCVWVWNASNDGQIKELAAITSCLKTCRDALVIHRHPQVKLALKLKRDRNFLFGSVSYKMEQIPNSTLVATAKTHWRQIQVSLSISGSMAGVWHWAW